MINNFFSSVEDLTMQNSLLPPSKNDFLQSPKSVGLKMIIEKDEDEEMTVEIGLMSTFASSRRSLRLKDRLVKTTTNDMTSALTSSTLTFETEKLNTMSPLIDTAYPLEAESLSWEDTKGIKPQDQPEIEKAENQVFQMITFEPMMMSKNISSKSEIDILSLEDNKDTTKIPNITIPLPSSQNVLETKPEGLDNIENPRMNGDEMPRHAEDEENFEDFLMIKPIIKSIEALDDEIGTGKNELINLDAALFPKKLIDYINSLPQDCIEEDFRQLIIFIIQNKDKANDFPPRCPKSEILYSIGLTSHLLATSKALLKKLSEKLKVEPVSLRAKYKAEISVVEANYLKATRYDSYNATHGPFRMKEKELEKLIQSITTLKKEEYILASRETLNSASRFYTKLLHEIQLAHNLEDITFKNGVQIDHITLPRLFEKALESTKSSCFRKLLIYTYDLYTSPLNLLIYFIFKFFEPKSPGMSQSKYTSSKEQILKIMQFWLQERTPDFIMNPDVTLLFDIFLEVSQVEDGQNGFEVIDTIDALSSVYNNVINTVPTKARKTYFSRVISFDEDNNCTLNIKSLKSISNKKTSAVTIPPFYMCKESLIENLSVAFLNTECESPLKPTQKKIKDEKPSYNYQNLLERSTDEIARQMTLIDWKIFSHINVRELIKKRWTRNEKELDCPTYWKYVSRFNSFSYWLQYIILSIKSETEKMRLVKKFIDVALLCKQRYKNYCTPHYIFSALLAIEKFNVIYFESPLKEEYEELKETFAPNESHVKVYEKTFRDMKGPATPSLNFFLKIFLKLQDGVAFKTRLPDSSASYLKFPILVQAQDYCSEMRRFQKKSYEGRIQKNENLYKYLKNGFRDEVSVNLEDSEAMMEKIMKLVDKSKQKKVKLLDYLFGFNRKEYHGKG